MTADGPLAFDPCVEDWLTSQGYAVGDFVGNEYVDGVRAEGVDVVGLDLLSVFPDVVVLGALVAVDGVGAAEGREAGLARTLTGLRMSASGDGAMAAVAHCIPVLRVRLTSMALRKPCAALHCGLWTKRSGDRPVDKQAYDPDHVHKKTFGEV
ncbi:MAG: hypothetical protein H7288_23440 [Kineosporiaceae bacterium]|nr:hypothetical protein [Aeromicrobium sp.]